MPGQLMPNLVIIGVNKAGTSSLFDYLHSHPQICASYKKEIRYFYPIAEGKALPSLESYTAYFTDCAPDTRYIMEASPAYYRGGAPVIEALRATLSADVRLICILREPVSRLISDWRYNQSLMLVDKSTSLDAFVKQCMTADAALLRDDFDHPLWCVEAGMYARHLRLWLATFGSALKIVFFDQLENDPRGLLNELGAWLELDTQGFKLDDDQPRNQTVGYKNPLLQRIALTLRRNGKKFWHDHPGLRQTARQLYLAINGDTRKSSVDEATKQQLSALYAPHNRELAILLRERGYSDLPAWLTE